MGEVREDTGNRRHEAGYGRREIGDGSGRQETTKGGRRREKGHMRQDNIASRILETGYG